jgi:hypothetical protein
MYDPTHHPFVGYRIIERSCIFEKMSSNLQKNGLSTIFVLMIALPLSASTTLSTTPSIPSSLAHQSPVHSDEALFQKSLRRDVMNHPNDFIIFETKSSADRFIAEHGIEVRRETDRRVIFRGIVGYWQGKMLVVLPSLATLKPI